MIGELSKEVLITRVANSAVAGTSLITSSVLDMTGYDAVMFIASTGTVTDASVLTLSALENTANSTSSPTPTAITGGATTAVTASTSSNGFYVLDVVRPSKRYVYCTLARTTQNAVSDGIIAIQYRARSLPQTQSNAAAAALSTPEV